MKSIAGTRTEQNVLKAFAGESQARNCYEFFAAAARKEGFEQIGALFLETAGQEKEHAKRFFKFLEGRPVEITATYPEFAKVAREEGFAEIAGAFSLIARVEAEHEKRYRKLRENVATGQVFRKAGKRRWVCRNCGHVHEGESAPEKCPACQHPQAFFEEKAENY
jgi:rubrerythrin